MNRREAGGHDEAAALHLEARSLRAAGRPGEAAILYRRAIVLRPRAAEHHVGLGLALRAAGQPDAAEAAYRQAIRLRPGMAEAHHNLGNLLSSRGDTAAARACYQKAVAANPALGEAHVELANLAEAEGDEAGALEALAAAALAQPQRPDLHLRLARLLQKRGDRDGAIGAYLRVLSLQPDQPETLANLGILLRTAGRHAEARASLDQALALQPVFPEAWLALGLVWHDCGNWAEAADCYQTAIDQQPDMVFAHVNLGIIHQRNGRVREGIASTRRALELDPRQYKACNNLGSLHLGRAEVAEAMEWQLRALMLKPDYHEALGNLCLTSNYADELGPESVFAYHREYGRCRLFAGGDARPHDNDPDPGRRLRIGFVSPDLRRHSVAFFLEPLLASLDRNSFEVAAYYNHAAEDEVTARLRGLCDRWCTCIGLDDAELAARIRADRIDILIDLAGHTDGNRLPVFALRPAPLQLTWLGYLTGTGLAAIDYRITDGFIDPEGYEAYAVEAPLRLPGSYLCYRPDPDAPEVGPLPALANGCITFGSFNNIAKIGPATVARWAHVLAAVPGSRLRLKNRNLADEGVRDLLVSRFAAHGIAPERLLMTDWQARADDHLAAYGDVDIALDTWPYNGVTTTCEALWMGVPVVSRVGATHASRQGRSLLEAVGLAHLAVDTDAEFMRACMALAESPTALARLRAGMRERLRDSTLLDAARFAADIGVALRSAWKVWCAGDSAVARGHAHGAKGPVNATA